MSDQSEKQGISASKAIVNTLLVDLQNVQPSHIFMNIFQEQEDLVLLGTDLFQDPDLTMHADGTFSSSHIINGLNLGRGGDVHNYSSPDDNSDAGVPGGIGGGSPKRSMLKFNNKEKSTNQIFTGQYFSKYSGTYFGSC